MQSLVESVSENLRSPGAKKNINLHLGTEFDAIPDACLEEVKLWLPREGTRFHERIQDYLAQYDADTNRNLQELPGRNRVSLVSFSYAKPTAASQSDEPDKPASQKSPRRLRR
jgi:hypothetical protein